MLVFNWLIDFCSKLIAFQTALERIESPSNFEQQYNKIGKVINTWKPEIVVNKCLESLFAGK